MLFLCTINERGGKGGREFLENVPFLYETWVTVDVWLEFMGLGEVCDHGVLSGEQCWSLIKHIPLADLNVEDF